MGKHTVVKLLWIFPIKFYTNFSRAVERIVLLFAQKIQEAENHIIIEIFLWSHNLCNLHFQLKKCSIWQSLYLIKWHYKQHFCCVCVSYKLSFILQLPVSTPSPPWRGWTCWNPFLPPQHPSNHLPPPESLLPPCAKRVFCFLKGFRFLVWMEGINMLEVIFPISVSFPPPSAAKQKALAPFALEEQRPLRVWLLKKMQILFHIQHWVEVDIKSSVEDFRGQKLLNQIYFGFCKQCGSCNGPTVLTVM